jgi:hypothetical protein
MKTIESLKAELHEVYRQIGELAISGVEIETGHPLLVKGQLLRTQIQELVLQGEIE